METTDYCSYELSLALKKCGFDEQCDSYYDKACAADDEHWHTKREERYNWNGLASECQISAPTLWQAQKWLREKWGIAINVDAHDGDFYTWDGIFLSNATQDVLVRLTFNVGFPSYAKKFLSYEEALSKGIAEALKLLDNEKK